MTTGNFVSYLRVSTARQGASGLGLEAQRAAVTRYLNGGDWQLLAEFIEVESGKNNARPELAKAIAHCRLTNAVLLVAKLDRLSRDAGFLLNLSKSGIEIRACDMPEANTMMFGMMALIAQHEREAISKRTKEALAQAKIRRAEAGLPKLGGWRGGPDRPYVDDKLGRATFIANADAFAQRVGPMIKELRDGGMSLRAIAADLTARGVVMPMGGTQWTATAVRRALARIEPGATQVEDKARQTKTQGAVSSPQVQGAAPAKRKAR
jgi:DNA invertase Pin-like site-specific DNA recombinase